MVKWHERGAAAVGLRLSGLSLLGLAYWSGFTLQAMVHSHPPSEASLGELGLCTLLVLSGLGGAVLTVFGPGLWAQVQLPQGRHASLAKTFEFDVLSGQSAVVLRRAHAVEEGHASVLPSIRRTAHKAPAHSFRLVEEVRG